MSRMRCQALQLSLALSIALGLTACVTPPRTEPQVQQVTAESLGITGAALNPIEGAWWRAYGDAQFDALMTKALEQNTSLQQTLSRVRAAQAQVQISRGGLGPDYSLGGEEVRQRYSQNFIYPPPFGGGTYWQGSLLANFAWDLDLWGRQAALLRAAQANSFAADLDASAAKLGIAVAVSQAYLDFNRAHVLAEIAQQTTAQRQQIVNLVRKRIDAGLDTTVELREAEAAVPQAELVRTQAEMNRDLAVHRLIALTGGGIDASAQLQRPTLNLDAIVALPDELPADLLGRRPDILAARARIDAATAQRAAARAAFYPNVNLRAFAGFQAIGLDNLLETGSRSYGAGPAFNLPLFQSSQLQGEYNRAIAETDEAIATYNDAVINAVRDVSDQLTVIGSMTQQLQQARASLTATEEAYRLAQRRYESGLANYLSVLTTETQVLNARTTYVELLHAQALARISLLLAVGGDFQPPAR